MDIVYCKRYRMEIDLVGRSFPAEAIPGYSFLQWDPTLLGAFAEAKYVSFRDEVDANVFPCLGKRAGCRRLMDEISHKSGFLPKATWLAVYHRDDRSEEYCGTIQGVRDRWGKGLVQNLAVTPDHRYAGLGSSLLFRSLEGFRSVGATRASLEVTALNDGAIRLYRRHGFTTVKTVFRVVEKPA